MVVPATKDCTPNSALLRILAAGIQGSVAAKYWNLINKRVTAFLCIDELAGYDSGEIVFDKPDNLDG